jgi:hypothetical protein
MTSPAEPTAENAANIVQVAAAFAMLAGAAWAVSLGGVAIAIAYYGASLLSASIYRICRAMTTRSRRGFGLAALALGWFAVLFGSSTVLPSNLGAALW